MAFQCHTPGPRGPGPAGPPAGALIQAWATSRLVGTVPAQRIPGPSEVAVLSEEAPPARGPAGALLESR